MMKYLACCVLLTCSTLSALPATIFYFSDEGRLQGIPITGPTNAVSILNLLGSPPPGLGSAVPEGSTAIQVVSVGEIAVVEFSPEILNGLGDTRFEDITAQVRATLFSIGIEGSVELQCGGRSLTDYLPPTPVIEPRPPEPQPQFAPDLAPGTALSGKSVSLSPGHGTRWAGSSYLFERPVYCSPLSREDDHNLEIMTYLNQYLAQDGAVTKVYRCLNKSYGTHSGSGEPWWRVSASYWLQLNGYPCSVYASLTDCTLGGGASESDDSLRSRGLAANYDNTTIYVSLHSNGLSGDCSGSTCPNGTATYYYTGGEHASWGVISSNLAKRVNSAIVSAIRTHYTDSTWTDRGVVNQNFAETRIPSRAAILIELAFHDSCDRDAVYLRDNFFRSTTMWATYKGICDYFGLTPGWDYYSYEIVSHGIPDTILPGATIIAPVTLRNRGVLWNDAKSFRLGAVGDSDPFTAVTRQNVGAEIGPGQTRTFNLTLTAPSVQGLYTTDWRMVREGVTWFGPTLSVNVLVSTNGDTQAPTVPDNLLATPVAYNQVNLAWQAATDNLRVSYYKIFRDSALIGTSTGTAYSDSNCVSRTTYQYEVSALDSSGNESGRSAPASATTLPITEFIIDNTQGVIMSGAWTTSTSSTDKYLSNYQWSSTATSQSATFRWTPNIEKPGFYTVETWYPQGSNRCTNSPFTINYAGGSTVRLVNQTTGGGGWVSLGSARPFITGTNGWIQLGNQSVEPSKVVMADAVRFNYSSALPALPNIQASLSGTNLVLTWSNTYCVLQQTASLTVPAWTDVPGASSPHTVNTSAPGRRFYRLRY